MEGIFEGLGSIQWSDLGHAYGKADDVPDLLRGLVSEDRNERQEALYQLLGNVWHQGTIYEASSYIIPFLVRMLRNRATPDRPNVALLLASIADGSSFLEVHALPGAEREASWRAILSKEGKDFDRQLELERKWVEATRIAVNPHLDLLYEFIDHEEPELRLAVSSALGNYPDHATTSLELLKTAIGIEVEEYVREAMEESKSRLEAQSSHG